MSCQSGRVFLVGMMGAGKSTAGRLLAESLGWEYLDTDEEVQRRTGRSIPEIWASEGEPAFRRLEAAVLSDVVGSSPGAVISAGGGAVLDPVNRALMKASGLVVWLRAHPDTLWSRVGGGEGRPLLSEGALPALRRLSEDREPLYRSVADLVLDVDRLSPREAADRVVAALEERSCTS